MTKWAYATIWFYENGWHGTGVLEGQAPRRNLLDLLNDLGAEGWQIVVPLGPPVRSATGDGGAATPDAFLLTRPYE